MEFLLSCPHCGRSYARLFLPVSGGLCRCGAFLPPEPRREALETEPRREDTEPRPGATSEASAFPVAEASDPGHPDLASRSDGPDLQALQQEEAALQEIRRLAERVSFLIVATDTPRIDVDIVRADLRRRCRELFPDKMHVYDLVYESRFQRLWQQFRAA